MKGRRGTDAKENKSRRERKDIIGEKIEPSELSLILRNAII